MVGVDICVACQGKGYLTEETLIDYHKGEYKTEFHSCEKCGGSGKVEICIHKEKNKDSSVYTLTGFIRPFKVLKEN